MKFVDAVEEFLELRYSLGFKSGSEKYHLNVMCKLFGPKTEVARISEQQVNQFLKVSRTDTTYWHRKYAVLCVFNRFLAGRGYRRGLPVPMLIPKRLQTFTPYILGREDIQKLLDGLSGYRDSVVLPPFVMRTVLLLMFGTGLRLCEVAQLTVEDVDLAEGVLTIQQSQFNKSRLVPLGPSAHSLLIEYVKRRWCNDTVSHGRYLFFRSGLGGPFNPRYFRQNFETLRDYVGLRNTQTGQRPRVHDLRHSFAVNTLTSWYKNGADVQRLLPQLSTYLGHVNLSSTQVYLTMTAELLEQANSRFEKYVFSGAAYE
jgi:integrase/recombinase XerD